MSKGSFCNCTLTHEAFMQRALYDPVEGYYAQSALLGTEGDFSTSATLSPAFAEAIAHWIKKTADKLNFKTPWPLIELGPGNGTLAKGISDLLGNRIELQLVESSEALKRLQTIKLKDVPHQHQDSLREALKANEGRGIIIANEFADAFPAMQLCWDGIAWREVCVSFDSKSEPTECLQPFAHGVDAEAPSQPRLNQRLFIHPSYFSWMQANLSGLQTGAMLTIDYGQIYPARECRAYARHERYEGIEIYHHAGRRDITCDVNFADLKRWGEDLGLEMTSLNTQREFLIGNLSNAESRAGTDDALAFLLNEMGAGGAFLCLEQLKSNH